MSTSRRRATVRTGLIGVTAALAVSVAVPGLSGIAAADPAAELSQTLSDLPITEIDAQLADAVRQAKAMGLDQQAAQALSAILSAQGQPDLQSLLQGGVDQLGGAAPEGTPQTTAPNPTAPDVPLEPSQADSPLNLGASGDALDTLQKATGAQLLTPALAPFCAEPTADNPLGLSTANVIAFPGPFPEAAPGKSFRDTLTDLNIPLLSDLLDKNSDIAGVTEVLSAEQTAYALVPPAGTADSDFQVAWFNTSTLKGGLVPLTALSENTDSKALRALLGGVKSPLRLARVTTEDGSVLSAVFGTTTTTTGRSCFFLPALGIVDNPA
ncbi:hypothetical protein [Gordonia sp. VNK21]|uniref:hypothetical protein n=1 Tax=Gordonia sp. VNK21 TaxID=3382483 RepID=UPI0038D3D113